jgi:SAM-dependent methyltransferase
VTLAELHAAYETLLRHALHNATPTGARLALDVGCGPGLKWGWLAETMQPGGLIVGVDTDPAALRVAHQAQTHGSSACHALLAADALHLPLRPGSADLAWCVAALRLFADPAQALRAMAQALRPGGSAVVAVAEQRWVRLRLWPDELVEAVSKAAPQDFVALQQRTTPADGLGDELHGLLAEAGFKGVTVSAWLADPGVSPVGAWLALADWSTIRESLRLALSAQTLAACEAIAAAEIEPEIAPVLLVASGKI